MSKNGKDKIYIPLWRDRCRMLMDSRLTDEQVGAIIRAAIAYDLEGTTPSPMGDVGLDVLCGVLISDIDISRVAKKNESERKRDAAIKRWGKETSTIVDENEIDLLSTGYFDK